ncbi:FAD-dependent monooxygenase [Streptomyces guryensis]|uniref:FAD-dependent monooxygenase n=1 Tax=Streptomyces guryensis TaxID=2886947 RepID=A0A9Q3VLM1_9ACTN|nr:FAD-dependent monooxygenase [Streptomyces guryensis]MCD9874809.1 FAD-dependent monooxygenase [Streptomyces guryensis]
MVIIGDAAHAVASSSGQGVSMAVEDAATLAVCLRNIPDTDRALAAFHDRRRQRVERVVEYGAKTSSDKAAGGLTRLVVRLLTPCFLRKAAKDGVDSLDWMFAHRIEWAERTGLGA